MEAPYYQQTICLGPPFVFSRFYSNSFPSFLFSLSFLLALRNLPNTGAAPASSSSAPPPPLQNTPFGSPSSQFELYQKRPCRNLSLFLLVFLVISVRLAVGFGIFFLLSFRFFINILTPSHSIDFEIMNIPASSLSFRCMTACNNMKWDRILSQ